MRSEFENSIKWSSSYEKLVYQHGERLFIFDDGKYKIAAVQLAWEIFKVKQAEVDELKSTIEKQKKLSLKAIENAKAGSSLELQLAQKLHAESSPDSLESERAMNAQLTNENLLLESKVDELKKLRGLDEMAINQIAQANQQWQLKYDELQKRVDAATAKWIAVTSIATTCPNQLPDEFFQKLDELHDALCGYKLEQALKGEG